MCEQAPNAWYSTFPRYFARKDAKKNENSEIDVTATAATAAAGTRAGSKGEGGGERNENKTDDVEAKYVVWRSIIQTRHTSGKRASHTERKRQNINVLNAQSIVDIHE